MITKLRNRLVALSCFLLFVSLGMFFFLTHSVKKPFAIILFIGDGMSPSLLTATRLYQGGADHRLALEEFPQAALTRTYAYDFAVPDAASAATALATGERVNKGSLAINPFGEKLTSLLEDASSRNRAVGIISNGSLTGETVAAFYAKSLQAQNNDENARQLLEHAPIDLMLGGGHQYFLDHFEKKQDEKISSPPTEHAPLLEKLTAKGISVIHSLQELDTLPNWKPSPVLGFFAEGSFPLQIETVDHPSLPSLSELVKQSIQRLQHSTHGYFLLIDDALLMEAASNNRAEELFHEISEFDRAIATARQYAGPNSLIIVTGTQNIGGLQMNGYPFRHDKGVAVLGLNQAGVPSITWATGPGNHVVSSTPEKIKEKTSILQEPSSFYTPVALGIAEDTITMALGSGSEKIHGFLDLTKLHDVIKENL